MHMIRNKVDQDNEDGFSLISITTSFDLYMGLFFMFTSTFELHIHLISNQQLSL